MGRRGRCLAEKMQKHKIHKSNTLKETNTVQKFKKSQNKGGKIKKKC